MDDDEATRDTADASDAKTVRAIRRRLGGAERAALGALVAVVSLFVVGKVSEVRARTRQRDAVLAEQSAIAAAVSRRAVALPARVASFATDLASGPWTGDALSPRLSRAGAASDFFSDTGIYLRVASTMAGDEIAIHEAAKTSTKDALSTCLLIELRAPEQDPMSAASGCEPGTACLGDRTGNLHNLRELHRGLDVLTAQFRRDVEDSEGLALHALGAQLRELGPDAIATSAAIADATSYALVVVDEVPAGFPMPWFASSLEAVQTTPHHARVAVIDTRTGEQLLRVRVDADRTVAAAAWPSAAVARQVQSCGVGLDVAAWIESARTAAR